MSVASVHVHYVAKAERKGRTRAEVDEVIRHLDRLLDQVSKGKAMEKVLRTG
jgi:hypothetical protein